MPAANTALDLTTIPGAVAIIRQTIGTTFWRGGHDLYPSIIAVDAIDTATGRWADGYWNGRSDTLTPVQGALNLMAPHMRLRLSQLHTARATNPRGQVDGLTCVGMAPKGGSSGIEVGDRVA